VALTVRAATVDDARAIAEVHVASWRWAYRGQVPDHILDSLSTEEREAHWRQLLEDGTNGIAVAIDDVGAVVGFVETGRSADDDADDQTGEVYAIYLLERVAGAGIGTALLRRGEDDLRSDGYRRSTLWVLESNERAHRFYERNGWASDGRRSTYRIGDADLPTLRYARWLSGGLQPSTIM
jgi:ribosomal protein S18 acetylase RimI-like enzyme